MTLFQFRTFPTLETARLTLREMHQSDAEAVFRIRGDYEVTRYNTGMAYTQMEQARTLIDNIRQAYHNESEIRWGITLKQGDDTVIGMVGFNYWSRKDSRASVGYDLARAYWGHGIMTEAVCAVVRFGFEHMALNRIEADADSRNVGSHRVLEKAGFKREGVLREQFYEDGAFYDLVLFSLLRKEWETRQYPA
jgi:ribosomal-protein-alanine N-acetyltransferase